MNTSNECLCRYGRMFEFDFLQNRRGLIPFLVLWLLLLLLLVACQTSMSKPPEEVVDHGFYAYALPEDIASERGWHVAEVDKPNWEAHCLPGPSASWNPITVTYLDENGVKQLTIRISGRDQVWVREHETVTVPVQLQYVPERTGIVYRDANHSPVKFTDRFRNEVVVDANFPIAEKLELISSFQYIGPEVSELVNPWSVEWCEQN